MANETLILRDNDGNYYQLDRAVLEAARVPEHRVPELEEIVEGEVTGYALPSPNLQGLNIVAVLRDINPPHGDIRHIDIHPG